MADSANVPQPGPAKLSRNAELDEWLEAAKRNKYLPEKIMKQLFEMCKELLMEGTSSPPALVIISGCSSDKLYRIQYPTGFYSRHYLW